jgi:hypothetical protein
MRGGAHLLSVGPRKTIVGNAFDRVAVPQRDVSGASVRVKSTFMRVERREPGRDRAVVNVFWSSS